MMTEVAKLEREKRRALNKNNLRDAANLANLLGQELQQAGDYEGALAQHKEEGALCEALGDTVGRAVSHRRCGEVYCDMGEWEKALKHQHQHLTLAKEAESLVEEQRAYATIGRTHLQRSEEYGASGKDEEKAKALTESEKAFLRSLSTCERLKGDVDTVEHCQMRCRLYLNLGLVLEQRGNSDKACNFINQALVLCEGHSLHEDAQRCHSALGSILLRKGLFTQALQEGQRALVLSVKLHDKALQCEGHTFLAQVHLQNNDFEAAKKCYYKAYKLKHPIINDQMRITNNLKTVVSLCLAEDALITLGASEGDEKVKLNEKLGDGLATLGLYSQALVYYQRMLDLSLRLDKEPSFLALIYLSLARTYYDNKQYEKAKEYYMKEYDIKLKEDYKEACKTLLNVADVNADLGESYMTQSSTYQQARELAIKANNPKLEAFVLSNHISLKGIPDSVKIHLQEEFNKILEENNLDPELELSEEEDEEEIDVDLDLQYFSDSGSDTENLDKPRQSRLRKSLVIKRNEKGETPLHKACIDGNLIMVKKLIQQGHPVNLRDNCGWLPLHEAANHGYYDIVQALAEAGAWISDRGGEQCDGITPMHDAASCGNIEVVKLLINLGASITTKTNEGDTPLESLVKFRLRSNLSEWEKEECRLLEQELREKMKQAGHKIPKIASKIHTEAETRGYRTGKSQTRKNISSPEPLNTEAETVQRKREGRVRNASDSPRPHSSYSKRISKEACVAESVEIRNFHSRHLSNNSDEDDYDVLVSDSPTPSGKETPGLGEDVQSIVREEEDSEDFFNPLLEDLQQESASATGTYLSAIGCVGSAARRADLQQHSVSGTAVKKDKKVALLSEADDVGDDWLDDDLGIFTKKRKRVERFAFEYKEPRKERKVSSQHNHQTLPNPIPKKVRQRQTKLTSILQKQPSGCSDGGGSRALPGVGGCVEEVENESLDHTGPVAGSSMQLLSSSNIRYKNTDQATSSTVADSPLRLKVRVQNRLLLVPVAGGGQSRTVAWLAEEVSRRYYQLSGLRPHLVLTTKDGAVLDPSDPISLVLPTEQTELEGQVKGWDLPPLPDRYAAACQTLNTPAIPALRSALHHTDVSTTLDLSCVGRLVTEHLHPVIRAIQYQHNLRCLRFANCRLGDDGFSSLMEALPSLPTLEILDLRASSISSSSLLDLTQAITADKLTLKTLCSLDISYNTLCGVKLNSMHTLLSLPALLNLSLKHCSIVLTGVEQPLSSVVKSPLKTLALDYNIVCKENLSFLLSCTPGVSTLTLSGLKCRKEQIPARDSSGVATALTRVLGAGEECLLQHLDLSHCSLTDTDLEDISAYLYRCPHLSSVNLAHNPALTASSFATLFSELTANIALPLTSLSLHGNEALPRTLKDTIALTLRQKATSKYIITKFSLTVTENDSTIENLWKSQHQGKGSIKKLGREMFLSCNDV